MKKFLAVALTILLVMSAMPMTGFAATAPVEDFGFTGFNVVKDSEGKGVVVDLDKQIVYGFSTLLKVSDLDKYLEKGENIDEMYVCKGYGTADEAKLDDSDFIGSGATIVLKTKDGTKYPFDIVIFGDVNGDSACDVLDAMILANISAYKDSFGADDAVKMAAKTPETLDEDLDETDYQAIVNSVVSDVVDQNKGTNANVVEDAVIEDQIYTGLEIKPDEDIVITFNEEVLSNEHYKVVGYEFNTDLTTGEKKAIVTIEGTGLFSGTRVIEFEIVGILQDIVNEVNAVIKEAALDDLVKVIYTPVDDNNGNVDIEVNASKFIRGDFDANMAAFNGLLARIDEYRAEKLQEVDCTVGEFALANNGSFSRTAIKNFVFDLASGIFCDIAYAQSNTIKSYSGSIAAIEGVGEAFNVNLKVTEDVSGDINRVKTFAAKISRYVGFDVVDGNAVINITMPAAFSTKVVEKLGGGDVDKAINNFNSTSVSDALLGYLAKVDATDISAGSAEEINQALEVVSMLGAFVNKGLGEITEATVTSNVKTMPLLNGDPFEIDERYENKFGAIVEAITFMLSEDVIQSKVGDFYKDGIYTVAADITLDYKNIKETVIVNLDLFGAVETPTIIEETATYFTGIINDLGLGNAVTVSYDKDDFRAVAALDARELVTNFAIDEKAFDGLYTEIKGYFDDNYGTATIVVGKDEIVTNGKINKSALKNLIFSAATGFFQDAANLGADNVLRSFSTVVTEADGTVHSFDLDFELAGSAADVERVAKIADKVASYVSFEVIDGNAVVSVGVPEGMRAKIIEKLGGDAATAQETFNNTSVLDALLGYVAKVEAEDISASSAAEINAMVSMVAGVDTIINKALGKVDSAVAYDVNGEDYKLLSEDGFVVEEESIYGLVEAFTFALHEEVLGTKIENFMNADGTYTVKCDVALGIGGIKETVILNLDVFGDYEKKTAIEETVDYAEDILADLGVSSFASVEYSDGKAVATFDATALLTDGLDSINEDAIDGLYTKIKDYFNANFGDSTITVGKYNIVKDGVINKPVVKDFIFDFATGFFTNVANMDGNTFKSYNTVVVDGEGNVEKFAFDFNLSGKEAHIEKLQTISAKAAELVSFSEVDGNAAVEISLPAGMKKAIVNKFGSVEAARATINDTTVVDLLLGQIGNMEVSDVSSTYAKDIQTAFDMIQKMDGVINKVLGKVEAGTLYDVNGKPYEFLNGDDFVIDEASFAGIAEAVVFVLHEEVASAKMGNFMNDNGTYTVECEVTVKGITEKISVTVDIF